MPASSGPSSGAGASGGGAPQRNREPQRTTFRPPWVKDGPQPIPMPSQPWTPVRRDSNTTREQHPPAPFGPEMLRKVSQSQASQDGSSGGSNAPPDPKANLRKTSKITIVPSQPQPQPQPSPAQPQLKQVEKAREVKVPIAVEPAKNSKSAPRENGQPAAPNKRVPPSRMDSMDKRAPPAPPAPQAPAAQPTKSSVPPPPPAPPAPPPPPPGMPGMEFEKPSVVRKPLSEKQRSKLDALKNRPRRRPDYGSLMKEIEGGAKLKKVQCNDRSSPLLPKVKAKGQFLYESESPNAHNVLLKQIETGVKLKKVKTNDRSKPILDGLRKFRRQMTIEEQMQKAEKEEPLEAEPLDDLDDIDRVRDDLQSTKQMLALELRNKEALERDNKRLLARLANMEAELEAARKAPPVAATATGSVAPAPAPDDKLVRQLKEEAAQQQKMAKDMEKRYHTTAEELDSTKAKLEEAIVQKKQMEKQLRELEDGLIAGKIIRQPSKRLISSKSGDIRKQASLAKVGTNADMGNVQEDSSSEYTEETVTESEDEEDGDDAAAQERRVTRELKLLTTKLRALKDKEQLARNEKRALRYQERNQQRALKAEKKKYKALQKEVDKMAKLMKEGDDDDEEEEEEQEESESSEESETESSEEESSEEEPPSGDDLPEDAPADDKKKNLLDRSKRHENILSALKKGNYLLKANIDRIKDDLNKHREMSLTLQEDLNSVLAELG